MLLFSAPHTRECCVVGVFCFHFPLPEKANEWSRANGAMVVLSAAVAVWCFKNTCMRSCVPDVSVRLSDTRQYVQCTTVYCTGRERKSNDRFPTEMIPLSCPGKFPLSSNQICHAGFGRKVQSENGTYGLGCWCVWNVLISLCAIHCNNTKKRLEPDGGGGVYWC